MNERGRDEEWKERKELSYLYLCKSRYFMTLASCHVMILCQKKEKKKRARFRRAINFKGPPAYSFTPESFAISSSRREPFFFTTYVFFSFYSPFLQSYVTCQSNMYFE